jgi:hypothetical protein
MMGQGGRGRTTSCGGRHRVSCERLKRSVNSSCSCRCFRVFDFQPRLRRPDLYGASSFFDTIHLATYLSPHRSQSLLWSRVQ